MTLQKHPEFGQKEKTSVVLTYFWHNRFLFTFFNCRDLRCTWPPPRWQPHSHWKGFAWVKYISVLFTAQTTNRTQGHGVPMEYHCHWIILSAFFLLYKVTLELSILLFDPQSTRTLLSKHLCVFSFLFLNDSYLWVMLITPDEHRDFHRLISLMLMAKQWFPAEPISASQRDCCFVGT